LPDVDLIRSALVQALTGNSASEARASAIVIVLRLDIVVG
jgi:hypothetical protein